MAHVTVETPEAELDEPVLLDGLPGMGLVGKLVADHLVDAFDMAYYGGVHCEGVPPVAAYRPGESSVRPALQLYADEARDVLALVSDVPVSPGDAPEFAGCITEWLAEADVTPVYLSGVDGSATTTADRDGRQPEVYGLSTGDGDDLLDEAGIVPPRYAGIVTGPTGALLERAAEVGLTGVGFLVESDDEFPDLDAARRVLDTGVSPLLDVDVDTAAFDDRSVETTPITQAYLEQLRETTDGTTRAQPTPMFH
jgi:uncharacterized protein